MAFSARFRPTPSGLTVLATGGGRLRFVRGNATAPGRPKVLALGEAAADSDGATLARAARQLHIPRSGARAMLLNEPDYRIHMVEAPAVSSDELKLAMRWRLKDIIDFPVEEASYDILDLPGEHRGSDRARSVYAIAAKKALLKSYVRRFDEAGLPVSVIDIPETAQRNIAALYEEENRAIALLYLDEVDGLLTITSGGELCLARRLDISISHIRRTQGDERYDLFNRILVELQRTLDNFERQSSRVVVGKLMLGPEPEETGLLDYLSGNLGIKVESVDLRSVIDVPAGLNLDLQTQWRLFHLIGCSLRTGPLQ